MSLDQDSADKETEAEPVAASGEDQSSSVSASEAAASAEDPSAIQEPSPALETAEATDAQTDGEEPLPPGKEGPVLHGSDEGNDESGKSDSGINFDAWDNMFDDSIYDPVSPSASVDDDDDDLVEEAAKPAPSR